VSATAVSYVHLACDTCGSIHPKAVHGATAARIAAAFEGWKYTEWDTRGKNTYANSRQSAPGKATRERRVLPTQWDSCPECPLPPGPEEAFEIREARRKAERAK
jgi:hypothetical protein